MLTEFPLSPRARRSGAGWVDYCPAHDDNSPSLSIGKGADGRLLLKCFAGCKFEDILAAAGVSRACNLLGAPQGASAPDTMDLERRVAFAVRIWRESAPIHGTLAHGYLRSRGLRLNSDSQRFHPGLLHVPSGTKHPALISAIVRDDSLVGIHRTFLTPEGQKRDRMMLGDCKGGAVRLLENGEDLFVAEGVETTTALGQMFWEQPMRLWAALSATGIENLKLPERPGKLLVGADGDGRGCDAAFRLCERAADAGWHARILHAPEGKDWNDVLLEEATNAT